MTDNKQIPPSIIKTTEEDLRENPETNQIRNTDPKNIDKVATKYDEQKLRWDLLPVRPLEEIAKVMTLGAEKYTERNWERGFHWSRVFSSLMRHCWAWYRGETYDKETGLHHMAHAGCNILFLLEYSYTDRGIDDRVIYTTNRNEPSETTQ
jgi:hypothetical protein